MLKVVRNVHTDFILISLLIVEGVNSNGVILFFAYFKERNIDLTRLFFGFNERGFNGKVEEVVIVGFFYSFNLGGLFN